MRAFKKQTGQPYEPCPRPQAGSLSCVVSGRGASARVSESKLYRAGLEPSFQRVNPLIVFIGGNPR